MKTVISIFVLLFIFDSNLFSQSWKELDSLGTEYYYKGDYKTSLSYFKEVVLQVEKEFGKNDTNYATSLNNLALLYWHIGQYNKAEPLHKEALKIRKEVLGEKHPAYSHSLNNLAVLYDEMGQYNKAEPLHKEALEIRKEIFGEKHQEYALSLNNLAVFYRHMGLYEKVEPLYKEALKIKKEIFGEKHQEYALSLNNLAVFYRSMGQNDKAEPLFIEALKIRKEVFGEKHPDYAESLIDLASLYRNSKQYEKAEPLYKEALKIDKEFFGEKHPYYAKDLHGLAVLYNYMEQYDKAETFYLEALKIKKEVLGEKHPSYVASLNNLAVLYYNMERHDEAEPFFIEVNKNYLNQIQNNFPFLTENQKNDFLKTIYFNFEFLYSFSSKRYKYNPFISSDMLNVRLISKGIILNSTVQMYNKIKNSGDIELIKKFDELIALKSTIIKAQDLTIEKRKSRGINLEELESRTEELEKEISRASSVEIVQKINWKDVQSSLKQKEIAIELVDFRLFDKRWTDITIYCALILKSDYIYPKLIQLCTEDELKNYLSIPSESRESYVKNQNTSKEIYKLLFKPLEEELIGAEKIYISPSGIINRISLNALMTETDELLIDKYNLYYIGNLKDIVKKDVETKIDNKNFYAAIFGGAIFDLDSSSIVVNSQKYKSESKDIAYLNIPDTIKAYYNREINERGGWGYLKGTLSEANKIKFLFEQNNLKVEQFTAENASEDAIKSLSQTKEKKSPTILHISTHGFFFPEPPKEYEKFQQLGGQEKIKYSENPLLRSGLILAGANYSWKTNQTMEGTENGVLTAYEVSNMDLQSTVLVVLSACETGLGDIKEGEGVYGLQRAFKVAGVKTIIMSLWKVPDKETIELMELFYTKWLGGMVKHDAFYNAQKEMRKKYPPYYWAAFVMVE